MSKDLNWKKISEEPFKAGWRKMLHKKFLLLNGKEAEYDVRDDGMAICGLVLTPENNVVLVKIFRPGFEKVVIEMPGGYINSSEKPIEAAKRELLEETGYTGKIEIVGKTFDDAYSNCLRYYFIAKDCTKVKNPSWDEDEESEIVEMSLEDFRNHLRSGNLTDVEIGYLTLDYLHLL